MSLLLQLNPTTGETVCEVAERTPDEITAAMQRARAAFPAWRDTPLAERLLLVRKLREYLVDNAETISREIAEATGKVFLEALMTEVFVTADALHYYEQHAAAFLRPERVKTPLIFFGNRSYVEYKPMGVVAVIAPWNYPFQLAMIPVVSALIAGNCVLLKPSEVTVSVGLTMEKAFVAAGFPADVVQVLHGGRDVGRLVVDARPDKIFFTGSVATGKKIMASAAEHLIPVELELGGKDPMIVFADGDLDRAARAAVWGAFTNAGQVCMSVERVYVERRVYDVFLQKVKAITAQLRRDVEFGSMTFPPQMEIVQRHLADAVDKGAQIECGGHALQEGTLYFAPTILTGVDHSMQIMRDETFGPVMPIMTFETEQEAVRLANDSDYGLNASVWTLDGVKAKRVASQLVSGNVCLNDVITTVANPHLPFGGAKHSGFGRYHGAAGLHAFCHQTSVMGSKGNKPREINWYPYTDRQLEAMQSLTRLLYGKNRRVGFTKLKNLVSVVLGTYRKAEPTDSPQAKRQTQSNGQNGQSAQM